LPARASSFLPPGTFSLKHGDGVVMVARQANGRLAILDVLIRHQAASVV
jgi:hypothetical protein